MQEQEYQRLKEETEARLQDRIDQLRMAASVLDNTSEGVMVLDEEDRILSVNRAFTQITGYRPDEVIGRTPVLLRSDCHDAAFYQAMQESLVTAGRWQGETWNRRKNGEIYPQWLTVDLIPPGEGGPARYVAIFTDITEHHGKAERIRHLAFHDALTGLPNRSLFFDRLQHGILKAEREHRRLAVMFIDLDRFKAINDSLGHEVGDLLLQDVGKRLTTCLRGTDTVARLGGDEFVVLLEDLDDPAHVAGVANNLIAVLSLPQEIAGYRLQVGASIGIALYPEDSAHPMELMRYADTAMYAAKQEGKESFRFYHGAMTQQAAQRLRMEEELRRAIIENELELHYQPLVRLEGSMPQGVEALLRWRHPDQGMLLPQQFIPLAEDTGLTVAIGDWVLAQVCRQQAQWRQHGINVRISVNLFAKQIAAEGLVDKLAALALENGLVDPNVEVEVSEKLVMSDPERHDGILRSLHDMGVTIAVDHFGTGGSSLAYLGRLPVNSLKIDSSLLSSAVDKDSDARVVDAIVALGRSLGLAVVAEGVENENQVDLLRRVGCPLAQGYFFAPPGPADVTEVWLATRQFSHH